ncbi:aliphatic sulfonate ABC transporter substrate-binding protein [Micrococcales bacterium 31B]|nr:aliphatic sulfonate ABC transporter substrate-binding protein [Micrococcales bacterium 31B]
MTTISRRSFAGLLTLATAGTLSACMAGESAANTSASTGALDTLNIDFATYNPLSLIIKEKGLLETALQAQGTKVNWVQSAGSNKANEALRSDAIHVGSTAGSAALLARANGSSIKVIDIYSQPEWSALVVGKGSTITSVAELKGQQIAATKGTDPYFFLLQALAANGLTQKDVTVQNLQHADGRTALDQGSVQAWSGLDPIMAAAENDGDTLLYRNVDFCTYGFLNATESFLNEHPETAQIVVNTYEEARAWAADNAEETASILAKVASIDPAVATIVIGRSNLDVNPVPGDAQLAVLKVVAPILVESGDAKSQADVDAALASIIEPAYATKATA